MAAEPRSTGKITSHEISYDKCRPVVGKHVKQGLRCGFDCRRAWRVRTPQNTTWQQSGVQSMEQPVDKSHVKADVKDSQATNHPQAKLMRKTFVEAFQG